MTASPARKPGAHDQSPLVNGRINVLVADETPMGCHLLENALKRRPYRFDVVACASTRADVLNFLAMRDVDIALLSEHLQDGPFTGFQVLRELRASHPNTRVVMLFKSSRDDLVIDAFRGGAKGVFGRSEAFGGLCKCIRAVHKGQIWANSEQLQLILGALIDAAPLSVVDSRGLSLLAKRESQVVSLLAEGLTNREIARKLGLSEHTVSNYLFRIYDKLGISSRVELVLYVLRQREAPGFRPQA